MAATLASFVAAFLSDPWKVVLGGGGIVGLLTLLLRWWRGRVRLRGAFLGEIYDVNGQTTVQVRIEVENLGREPTSLLPVVVVSYLYPRRTRGTGTLEVRDAERTLSPVTPRTITLAGSLPAGYLFSHFRVFTVHFTRGGPVRLRVLNASGNSAGVLRFNALKLLFRLFGALPHVGG